MDLILSLILGRQQRWKKKEKSCPKLLPLWQVNYLMIFFSLNPWFSWLLGFFLSMYWCLQLGQPTGLDITSHASFKKLWDRAWQSCLWLEYWLWKHKQSKSHRRALSNRGPPQWTGTCCWWKQAKKSCQLVGEPQYLSSKPMSACFEFGQHKNVYCIPLSRMNRRTNLHQILHRPPHQLREGY